MKKLLLGVSRWWRRKFEETISSLSNFSTSTDAFPSLEAYYKKHLEDNIIINQLISNFSSTDSWEKNWVYSKHEGKEFGSFVRTAGKFFNDEEQDKGKSRFHWWTYPFPRFSSATCQLFVLTCHFHTHTSTRKRLSNACWLIHSDIAVWKRMKIFRQRAPEFILNCQISLTPS